MTAILEPQDTVPAPPAAAPAPETAPAPTPAFVAPRIDPAPAPVAAAPARESRVRALLAARPELTPTGVRLIGAAMIALFWVAVAIEPVPDGPQPVLAAWETVLASVQTFAMLAALAGFAMGRRWALSAGLLFAGIGAVAIAMCPASGHHVVSGWWFGQVALGAGMLLLPALALWRTRPGR